MHQGIMEQKSARSNFLAERESREENEFTLQKQLTHHKVTMYDNNFNPATSS